MDDEDFIKKLNSSLDIFDTIAALDEYEFKKKLEKKACDYLVKYNPKFEDAIYIQPSEQEINSMKFNIDSFSNYTEMLEDALLLSSVFGKRGYELENGRLHRTMARISILLGITAAEDYVNFILLTKYNYSKNKLKNLDLVEKWEILIPDIKNKFPDFLCLKKVRNDSIVHYKNHKSFTLQELLNLNYENGIKAAKVVAQMIKEYEKTEKECIRLANTSYILGDILKVCKEILECKNDNK